MELLLNIYNTVKYKSLLITQLFNALLKYIDSRKISPLLDVTCFCKYCMTIHAACASCVTSRDSGSNNKKKKKADNIIA